MPPLCYAAADGTISHVVIGPRSRRATPPSCQQAAVHAAPVHPPAHRDHGPDLACSAPRSIADTDAETATLALAWHLTCALSQPPSPSSEATSGDMTQGQRRGKVRLRSRLRSLFKPVTAAVGLQATLRPSLAHAADADVAASSVPAGIGAVSTAVAAALPSPAADAAPPSSPAVDLSAAEK